MSLCSIEMEWADGSYTFALPLAQLEELQTICDAGPLEIQRRLEEGRWTSKEVYHTLRLGLIGGGMKPEDALRKTKLYVLGQPWLGNVFPAHSVIQAVLVGKPDEPVGKSQADGEESDPPAGTASSTSASSTLSAS